MGININKMKVLITAIILISLQSICCTQTFVQTSHNVRYTNDGFVPTATVFVAKDMGEKKNVGISTFLLVTQNWAEFYVGPYFRPIPELTLGISAGFETSSPYWRVSPSAVFFKDNHLAKAIFEKGSGEGNYWYLLSYMNMNKKVFWGAESRRFFGTGPVLGVKAGNSLISLAPYYDFESDAFQPTLGWTWTL